MKVTEKNYQSIWSTVKEGDVLKYSKSFKFADVSFHALKAGVRLLPDGNSAVVVLHIANA